MAIFQINFKNKERPVKALTDKEEKIYEKKQNRIEKINKFLTGDFFKVILPFCLGLIFFLLSAAYSVKYFTNFANDFNSTGQIGDTIGGLTSPLFNLFGSILLFISFLIQYQANKQQKEALENEIKKSNSLNEYNQIISLIENLEKEVSLLNVPDYKLSGPDAINFLDRIVKGREKLNSDDIEAIRQVTLRLNLTSFIFRRIWVFEEPNDSYNREILEQRFYTLLSKFSRGIDILKTALVGYTGDPVVKYCHHLSTQLHKHTEDLRKKVFHIELYDENKLFEEFMKMQNNQTDF